MRRSPSSIAVLGLALAGLAIGGGTVIGGDVGPLTAGYGLLVGLAALYALVGLAIRDRVWRRLTASRGASRVQTVGGHRLF